MEVAALARHKVQKVPDSVFYIPDYITSEEEEHLLRNVSNAPKPKWTQLLNRRLQNWGGLPHPKGMLTEPIPEWLKIYCERVSDMGVFSGKRANHVLVNEYESGQGIMPHLDGSLYYPTVSTISLGSHTLLNFYRPAADSDDNEQTEDQSEECSLKSTHCHHSEIFAKRHIASIFLERRSLVIVRDDMYNTYLHGISELTEDFLSPDIANLDLCKQQRDTTLPRSTRVSLTIRHVPKTMKLKLPFGKR